MTDQIFPVTGPLRRPLTPKVEMLELPLLLNDPLNAQIPLVQFIILPGRVR